ncbi:hypothetical protein [Streptomyces sp. NPDC047123]|uniref:hypothetical protein n=1 Tax=Streptomyces sp. NPDC047123 TaxID=3155622 RepID=UPI0034022507
MTAAPSMPTPPPTPPDTDAAAFVAALRRLKAWSGLSYRQLERRAAAAGHVLPYSTAATLLGKDRLPRREVVVAFVAACGLEADEARAWPAAHLSIACGDTPAAWVRAEIRPAAARRPPDSRPKRPRPRRPRRALAGAAALLAVLLGGTVANGTFTDNQEVQITRPISGADVTRE